MDSDKILGANYSVPSEESASIIGDNRTDINHMDEIVVSNDNPDGIQQNRDILKEIASINQLARDQHAYKKTTNWHQQSADPQVPGQADQLRQIIQHLEKIEEKIDNLAEMLK